MQEYIMSDNQLLFDNEINEIIIDERNKEIKKLEEEFTDLRDSMQLLSVLLVEQGENLDISENNLEKTAIELNEANIILEKIPDKKETLVKNIKIVSSIIIGGLVLGGVGSVFGIIPGIIGLGLGSGSGAVISIVSNLVK